MATIIVYSARTNRCRRIIRDEFLTVLGLADIAALMHSGERLLDLPDEIVFDTTSSFVNEVQIYLNRLNLKAPINDRYVAVNRSGFVGSVIIADPDCGDSIVDHQLIATDTAKLGDRKLSNDTFVWPDSEIDTRIAYLDVRRLYIESLTITTIRTQERIDAMIAAIDSEIAALRVDKAST